MEEAARLLSQCLQANRGRLMAALVSRIGHVQRAEDALQEAAASALVHWGRNGPPDRPEGWLLKAALRKAIDAYRRDQTQSRHAEAALLLAAEEAALPDQPEIADDRLRLIFTCCHPALEPKSRVALTLRIVCGLTTSQIAAAFLDSDLAMGQRLSRAKAKISAAGIPFAIPGPDQWPERLHAVLTVVYLTFTVGYTAGRDGRLLCEEALFLGRLLAVLCPEEPEVEGCLALLCLTHARARARVDGEGATLPPDRQDRTLWDAALLDEGHSALDRAMARGRPGPFQIKAAIAACHAMADGPDWPQISALYDRLMWLEPTAPVALAAAIARMEAGFPAEALRRCEALAEELEDYQPFHAARAEMLRRLNRQAEARLAYDRALAMTTRAEDAAFLRKAQGGLAP